MDTVVSGLLFTSDTLNCNDRLSTVSVIPDLSILDYRWSGPNMFTSIDSVITVTLPGEYSVIATGQNGCQAMGIVEVLEEKDVLSVVLSSDSLNCKSVDPQIWYFTADQIFDPKWHVPNGSQVQEDTIALSEPGWYVLEYESENDCTYFDSIMVEDYRNEYNVEVVLDTIDCDNPVVTISAVSDTSGIEFYWLRGIDTISTDSTFLLSRGGAYILVADDGSGCLVRDSFVIAVDTARPDFRINGRDTINCKDSVVDLTINTTSALRNISWTRNMIAVGDSTVLSVTDPGQYRALLTAWNGCSSEDSIAVLLDTQIPLVQTQTDTITCLDSLADLKALGGSSLWHYLWFSPSGDSLIGTDIQSPEAGKHTLLVRNMRNHCTGLYEVFVEIDTSVDLVTLNDTTLTCRSDSIILSVEGGMNIVQYNWSGPNSYSSVVRAPAISVPGTYHLMYIADNDCIGFGSVQVLDNRQIPTAALTGDTINCDNDEGHIEAQLSTNVDSFYWIDPDGSLSFDTNRTVQIGGTYDLVVIGENECRDTVSTILLIDTIPLTLFIEVSGNLGCQTDKVLVGVRTDDPLPGSDPVYSWSARPDSLLNGIRNESTITVTKEGLYIIDVINERNGCESKDSIHISQTENIIRSQITSFSPSCEAGTDGVIRVDSVSGGTMPYMINFNNLGFALKRKYGFLISGEYQIQIMDARGCEFDTTVNLDDGRPLLIDAGRDTCIVLGDTVKLMPTDIPGDQDLESVRWTPNYNIVDDKVVDAEVYPLSSQVYNLFVVNKIGCIGMDKVQVIVKSDVRIFVPNIFSPNGDGLNDNLEIFIGKGVKSVYRFSIFDRWGNMVFHQDATDQSGLTPTWDGNFNNEPCLPGVYTFILYATKVDDSEAIISGDITILW
jgi:gliding motility-associated-like protein